MFLTRVYDALLTVAYPQGCRVCGGSVEERALGVACAACWKSTRIFTGTETICWKCGALLPGLELSTDIRREVRCHSCDSQSFSAARAVGLYEKALRESVLGLKRQPHVSGVVMKLLVETAKREPLPKATCVMAVPLDEKRLRERGFNQAAVIAEALAKRLKLPLDDAHRQLGKVPRRPRSERPPRHRKQRLSRPLPTPG